jgi:hypothetical protein
MPCQSGRDLKGDLGIARSLLEEGLITKTAFREIQVQAAAEKYDNQRRGGRNFGEYIRPGNFKLKACVAVPALVVTNLNTIGS